MGIEYLTAELTYSACIEYCLGPVIYMAYNKHVYQNLKRCDGGEFEKHYSIRQGCYVYSMYAIGNEYHVGGKWERLTWSVFQGNCPFI